MLQDVPSHHQHPHTLTHRVQCGRRLSLPTGTIGTFSTHTHSLTGSSVVDHCQMTPPPHWHHWHIQHPHTLTHRVQCGRPQMTPPSHWHHWHIQHPHTLTHRVQCGRPLPDDSPSPLAPLAPTHTHSQGPVW